MTSQLLHESTFYLMYGCLALTVFISVERIIFYRYTGRHARELNQMLSGDTASLDDLAMHLESNDSVPAAALKSLARARRIDPDAQEQTLRAVSAPEPVNAAPPTGA